MSIFIVKKTLQLNAVVQVLITTRGKLSGVSCPGGKKQMLFRLILTKIEYFRREKPLHLNTVVQTPTSTNYQGVNCTGVHCPGIKI